MSDDTSPYNGDPGLEGEPGVVNNYLEAEATGDRLSVALLERAVNVVRTDVPGLAFAVSSTAERGLQVAPIDFRRDLPLPARVDDTRIVTDVASLFSEVDRRPLFEASTIWASEAEHRVTVIYDDHHGTQAQRRADRLSLALRVDEGWTAVHKFSGEFMAQEEFGDVMEELLPYVVDPEHADLMEVIESIRVSNNGVFESGIRRSDGQQTLTYREEMTTSAGAVRPLEVPKTMTFRVPRFEGTPFAYDLEAWFRLRVVGGSLRLAYKLKPTRQIEQKAWGDVRTEVAEQLGQPVYATV